MLLRQPWFASLAGLSLTFLALAVACGGGGDDGDTSPATSQVDNGGGAPAATNDPGADPTAPADGIDSCQLLTREEVEEALGQEAADEPDRSVSEPYQTCTWNTKDTSLKFVIVQIQGGVTLDEFMAQQASAGTFLNEEVHPVDGLGDAAYEVGGFLYAHQGDYELVMTNLLGLNFEIPEEAEQALEVNRSLTEKALSRLP